MTSKHTPGPWEATEAFVNNEPNRLIIRRKAWGAPAIADCGITLTAESRANAAIIAAAPLMLEALNQVFDAAEDCGPMNDIDWDLLRAAIAKATGGAA